eukprot:CAMPEP_0174324328 /NCGR_PEP_ID=MMETSP0810-20121108/12419_1 /TAXON_ID=73025 ORGANISM="Eutreptiella gymnastica-like, Strain CCMP1594" /NCGR_SAMPLE_ID=MMETSP0810 /ASSEMBLY_ACC=CAM_ASM_000659 /LENGTH=71 /DNA_ID=CAMNT_0015437089 /DNA_START=122 /DNA_END=337 /DNA_ORIENTATION=+
MARMRLDGGGEGGAALWGAVPRRQCSSARRAPGVLQRWPEWQDAWDDVCCARCTLSHGLYFLSPQLVVSPA